MEQCPPNWSPGCVCYGAASLEPNDDCYKHGYPDIRRCPNCGQFRGYTTPCRRCGCSYGQKHLQPLASGGDWQLSPPAE